MEFGLRGFCLVIVGLILCGGNAARAGDCPGHPDALGVSRVIAVDPRAHTRVGAMSYEETLPLADHEVVLTFDDGPLPPYTDRVLDILASQCIHATYFIVGEMAKAYPDEVKKIYEAGHTVGTHSMTHPLRFRALGFDAGKAQIEDGIAATAAALGDPSHLAPFFRFPGFGHTPALDDYLASRGLMAWGADAPADDWKRISAAEIARRALRRLEARGKGILLLHDIHQRTVEALPMILKELKENGFRIVHVVPATEEQPATVASADAWLVHRRRTPPLIAAINLDSERLIKASVDELCAMPPEAKIGDVAMHEEPKREVPEVRERDGERTARHRHRHHHRRWRTHIAKAPAAGTPEIHSVQ